MRLTGSGEVWIERAINKVLALRLQVSASATPLPLQSARFPFATPVPMLTSLYVRQFAVVEEAEVAFGPGLTVVSGETSAGKSLLVDALMLLAGARADSGMVRAAPIGPNWPPSSTSPACPRPPSGCASRSSTMARPASCAA